MPTLMRALGAAGAAAGPEANGGFGRGPRSPTPAARIYSGGVAFERRVDGPEGARELPGVREIRRDARNGLVAIGTLACPQCDAPVALDGPAAPADRLACPYCAHGGRLREFLSLEAPARPARVEVRIRGSRRTAA